MLWAMAKLSWQDWPLWAAISAASMRLLQQVGSAAQAIFVPQDLTNTAWALAFRRFLDGPLLAAISSSSIKLI